MRIAFYVGGRTKVGHYLNIALNKNRSLLGDANIGVALQKECAVQIREILRGGIAAKGQISDLLHNLSKGEKYDRLVFSNEHLFSSPSSIFEGGELYPKAEQKTVELATLFEGHEVTFLVSIECLATFFDNTKNQDLKNTLFKTPLTEIFQSSWYELLQSIVELIPTAKIIVVVAESAPAHFEKIFREFTGYSGDREITGAQRFMSESLDIDGCKKLAKIAASQNKINPVLSEKDAMELLMFHRKEQDSSFHNLHKIWPKSFFEELELSYREDIEDLMFLEQTKVIGNYFDTDVNETVRHMG